MAPIRTSLQISPTPLSGKGRQVAERRHLVLSMQPVQIMVEDQENPPCLGKGETCDDRRRPATVVLAGVEDDAAPVETCNADAGAVAARQPSCVAAGIKRQSVQRAQRCRHRKRDLCAGTQPGVARDSILDYQAMVRADAEMPAEVFEMRCGTFAFRSLDHGFLATRQPDRCLRLTQRQSDTAETPARNTVRVEKAEMQAGTAPLL